MKPVALLAALALAGTAAASAPYVLAKPPFPGPADGPGYLYALDRTTGKVKGRLLLPSAPERIARHGNILTVDTYDHRVVVRVVGG